MARTQGEASASWRGCSVFGDSCRVAGRLASSGCKVAGTTTGRRLWRGRSCGWSEVMEWLVRWPVGRTTQAYNTCSFIGSEGPWADCLSGIARVAEQNGGSSWRKRLLEVSWRGSAIRKRWRLRSAARNSRVFQYQLQTLLDSRREFTNCKDYIVFFNTILSSRHNEHKFLSASSRTKKGPGRFLEKPLHHALRR